MLDPHRAKYFPRGIPPGRRSYRLGPLLDQGPTGTCVAHGWANKIIGGPVMQPMPLSILDFYRRVVKVDEWPDNDYEATAPDGDLQSGTSVRAGAKALVDIGIAKTYLWAESAEDVRGWMLSGFGGVVLGITWKENMMDTDADGFISYTGVVVGGHCVYLNEWNDSIARPLAGKPPTAGAGGPNQWGGGWGRKGRFYLTMDELDTAIKEDGEACALTELRLDALKQVA
jgi:hypothetical protein